jgi:hypothetical protein
MVVDNVPFLSEAGGTNRIGNVFYNQGIVTITRGSQNYLTGSWELNYKSTQTIYENEYLLIVNEDEFNVSQNPSAISIVNEDFIRLAFLDITLTFPGIYPLLLSTLSNDIALGRYPSPLLKKISSIGQYLGIIISSSLIENSTPNLRDLVLATYHK